MELILKDKKLYKIDQEAINNLNQWQEYYDKLNETELEYVWKEYWYQKENPPTVTNFHSSLKLIDNANLGHICFWINGWKSYNKE